MNAITGKIFIVAVFFICMNSSYAVGDTYMKCGSFIFSTSGNNDGFPRINGAKPETQELTFLKGKGDYDNVKLEWMMATNQPNTWVGLEYIKRNGKAILNAEWIRAGVTGVDQPRRLATYDCVRVK